MASDSRPESAPADNPPAFTAALERQCALRRAFLAAIDSEAETRRTVAARYGIADLDPAFVPESIYRSTEYRAAKQTTRRAWQALRTCTDDIMQRFPTAFAAYLERRRAEAFAARTTAASGHRGGAK